MLEATPSSGAGPSQRSSAARIAAGAASAQVTSEPIVNWIWSTTIRLSWSSHRDDQPAVALGHR